LGEGGEETTKRRREPRPIPTVRGGDDSKSHRLKKGMSFFEGKKNGPPHSIKNCIGNLL